MKKLLILTTIFLTISIFHNTQGAASTTQSMIINIQNVANSITSICNTNSQIITSLESYAYDFDSIQKAKEILKRKNTEIITNIKNFLTQVRIHALNPLALQQIYSGMKKLESTATNFTAIIQKNKTKLDESDNQPITNPFINPYHARLLDGFRTKPSFAVILN